MDFSKNLVLKENYTFLVADGDGMIASGERGLYNRDTRFLKRYLWRFGQPTQTLLAHTPRPDRFEAHYAVIDGPSQRLGVRRTLELSATRMTDLLLVENTSLEEQRLDLTLEIESDFADLFEARGWYKNEREIAASFAGNSARLDYEAQDGLKQSLVLHFSQEPERAEGNAVGFAFRLAPQTSLSITVRAELHNPLETDLPGVPYETWMAACKPRLPDARHQRVLERAAEDLRALLLFTKDGPMPAAGIPWFVTAFGRDSLLSAYMMLPHYPEVAQGTLRYLAARQGKKHDPFHAEAPGKILHEVRYGELSRLGKIPFGTYYGTVDATPLFIRLLHETWRATEDDGLVLELKPNWEAALNWMETDGDPDKDGFLEFAGAKSKGLSVQSWKDSHDSLSHWDGRLAQGAIAVSEVQGYAYAAYLAAAAFYEMLGEAEEAARRQARAQELKERFHEAFWLEPLQTYALALDGDKRPLEVLSSDAGQLLWTGIVLEDTAPKLVKTLFSDALFSGWGIRTLGANEARYNPVSYHNGSVWPHDTALIAGGLARYGFLEEAAKLKDAIFSLAASQSDLRPPELIAGYPRSAAPPVPYPVACRPQAWSAAALLYLANLPQKPSSPEVGSSSPQRTDAR